MKNKLKGPKFAKQIFKKYNVDDTTLDDLNSPKN